MQNERPRRGRQYIPRKQHGGNQPPRSQNYSPSASFNFNRGGSSQQKHQQPRRNSDRFKREILTQVERLVKQNNTIIQLLTQLNRKAGGDDVPEVQEPAAKKQDETPEPGNEAVQFDDE
mgnify:CR=1 FL=1